MSKILKFEQIWAEIFKEYWRPVKIKISNLLGICDIIFSFFIWKQNGSRLVLHASKFICLRQYNLHSVERIDANQGGHLCRNDAKWGWNHAKWCKSAISLEKGRLKGNQKGAIGSGSQQNCQVMPFNNLSWCLTFQQGYIIPRGHHLRMSSGSLSILIFINVAHFHNLVQSFFYLSAIFSPDLHEFNLENLYFLFFNNKKYTWEQNKTKTMLFSK